MSETQKTLTLAEIVAEMRNGAIPKHRTDHELLALYADRIEAVARRAYNEIDSAVCAIEDASHFDIDDVRKAMNSTIGDYYE